MSIIKPVVLYHIRQLSSWSTDKSGMNVASLVSELWLPRCLLMMLACLLTPQEHGLESVSISLHQSLNLVIYVCDTF